MRAIRHPGLTARETGILLAGCLAALIVGGALIAANTRWSAILPGGRGFYASWAAAREFLIHGASPYGDAAAAQAQQLVRANAVHTPQDSYRLDLPFFLMPLFLPLGLIADPVLARGVWASLAQIAVISAISIYARLVDWHPPRPLAVGLPLIAILSYPTVAALVDGTLVALLLLVFAAVMWFIKTGNDELAGGLVILALCKWEVGLPFLVILALRVLQLRRWRIAAGFGMALTILLALAFLAYPGWFMPFLVSTVAIIRSGYGTSTQAALGQLMLGGASRSALALSGLILSLLLVETFNDRTLGSKRFTWTACLALAVTPLIGMRSEISNLIAVVPGMVMIAAGGSQRRPPGPLISLCLLTALLGMPWIVAITSDSLTAVRAEAMIFIVLPTACLLGMYWTRWWFLRPARTWMDEIREVP